MILGGASFIHPRFCRSCVMKNHQVLLTSSSSSSSKPSIHQKTLSVGFQLGLTEQEKGIYERLNLGKWKNKKSSSGGSWKSKIFNFPRIIVCCCAWRWEVWMKTSPDSDYPRICKIWKLGGCLYHLRVFLCSVCLWAHREGPLSTSTRAVCLTSLLAFHKVQS